MIFLPPYLHKLWNFIEFCIHVIIFTYMLYCNESIQLLMHFMWFMTNKMIWICSYPSYFPFHFAVNIKYWQNLRDLILLRMMRLHGEFGEYITNWLGENWSFRCVKFCRRKHSWLFRNNDNILFMNISPSREGGLVWVHGPFGTKRFGRLPKSKGFTVWCLRINFLQEMEDARVSTWRKLIS